MSLILKGPPFAYGSSQLAVPENKEGSSLPWQHLSAELHEQRIGVLALLPHPTSHLQWDTLKALEIASNG